MGQGIEQPWQGFGRGIRVHVPAQPGGKVADVADGDIAGIPSHGKWMIWRGSTSRLAHSAAAVSISVTDLPIRLGPVRTINWSVTGAAATSSRTFERNPRSCVARSRSNRWSAIHAVGSLPAAAARHQGVRVGQRPANLVVARKAKLSMRTSKGEGYEHLKTTE